ncbi:MAG: PIN domain protein [Candidatus Accumulibacter adjunctus]|uniref:PIN domain protein n=1 Tax=Candidatus Accumulibacter adjunctus TaxID=1454001 RepID=A0A011NQ19_9PROT|nr:MAG: PIN domain protein [Candidatus Accumulibacter adjunctus]
MIAFFDASALIYLVEGSEPFSGKVRSELAAAAARHPELAAAVCRLTWLECRVQPMKANDPARLALFDGFFARPDLIWVELSKDVVELATIIRARHGLRTPDALQAARCLQLASPHLFLTGDPAFNRVAGLHVRLLTDDAPP